MASRRKPPRPVPVIGKPDFGVRLFKRAPEGFNPLAAKPRELIAYGYPLRPDPSLQPALHEVWTRMLSRPITLIEPQFALMKDKARRSRTRYSLPSGLAWCGSIARPPSNSPDGGTFAFISGQWTVPNVIPAGASDSICACWVGIDGGGEDSNDILQAGTTQEFVGTIPFVPPFQSYAWFEWYPAPPATITNFAVSAGDTIYCTICANSPTEAIVRLLNVTSGVATVFIKSAPKKTQLAGDTAEWVIEAPIDSGMDLGRFGDVYFDSCIAGTTSGQLLFAGDGALVPMYDTHANVIARATAVTQQVIKVQYAGP